MTTTTLAELAKGVITIAGCLSVLFSHAALVAAPQRILIIGTPPDHPWGSHMYEFDGGVLAKCLRQTDGVEAEAMIGWPADSARLDSLACIVFYSRPAGGIVMHPDHHARFHELMRRGTGFVCIHWGTGVGYTPLSDDPKLRDAFRKTLGGWFRRPPCDVIIGKSHLHQLQPDHPIHRGWTEHEIHDEFYLDPVLDQRAVPLLRVQSNGKDHTVGWAFERQAPIAGRSVGITLGHFHHNFERPVFRRMLVNAILWSSNIDVPADGARVAMDASALQLPKETAPAKAP